MTFFHLLKENARLWDSCFKKFHFSVWIPKEEAKLRSNDGIRHTSLLERNMGFPKAVVSVGRIPPGGEYSRCPEIYGLLFTEPDKLSASKEVILVGSPDEAPNDAPKQAEPKFNHIDVLKDALIHAEHVSLIDNSSIEHISQISDESLMAMKCLWLENSAKITRVINRIEDVGLGQNLSSLYFWNLSSLTSMYDDTLDSEFFPGLNTMHIDCSKESAECKLRKSHLVELPKLVRIGISMPHLKELKLRGGPGVEDLGKVLGKAEYLELFHISDAATLKSISSEL